MQLYNTMSRTVEDLEPRKPGQVGLYACGPTVYDYAHLGHLRKYTMDDVLVRALHHAGYTVTFVQNITDVGHLSSDADTGEDKMEKGAKKYQTTVWELARKFEEYFWYSMDQMGNIRPDVSARATEHIPQQLQMVQALVEKGYGYIIEDDGIYFDTSQVDDYGKLAGFDVTELKEGARVEKVAGKRNAADFALWKFEREGENRAMVWESPWSERSFPGWHIECSAMSIEYLGEQFDIHTGGIDHIPVHHTNEIAQSEAATDKKPFVKYWVHHNFLQVEGEKMSKSLENFFTIDDVTERGYHPLALRLLFLTAHYRSEMNFTWDNLAGAQRSYQKLIEAVIRFKNEQERTTLSEDKLQKIDTYRQKFFELIERDLATPEAMAVVWEIVKSNIPGPDKYDLLVEFDEVLGLGLRNAEQIINQFPSHAQVSFQQLPAEIQELIQQREQARQDQDWERADQLRQQLQQRGYELQDTTQGLEVRAVTKSE